MTSLLASLLGLRRRAGVLAALTAAMAAPPAHAADPSGSLELSKAWVPVVEQRGADTPLFMTVVNHSAEPDDLLRVRCPVAHFSEKRTTDYGEGAPAGREVRSIPIPANGTQVLKPGGYHVMLLKTTEPLEPGKTFSCSVSFKKAGSQQVQVAVSAEKVELPSH
jgi:copper(I)-binding protein